MNARVRTARTPPVAHAVAPLQTSDDAAVREVALWNKEVVPFARDLLFVLGVFGYLIGFANHTAKMSQFGMETQLADQPVTSLFTWAAEAIHDGWVGFALIFSAIAAFLLLAGFLKHNLATSPVCRPLVYGIVTVAICAGLVLSYAWSSNVGVCDAQRNWIGDKKLAAVLIRIGPHVRIPALTDNPDTPPPAYILSETNDAYQILVTQPSPDRPIPMIVPRSEVLSVEYRQSIAADARRAVTLTNDRYPGPRNIPTPDPRLSGAGGQSDGNGTGHGLRLTSCYRGLDV